eukprot:7431381-Ditylum_brightwellii.AAC.1
MIREKFRIKTPRNTKEALLLDKKNGDSKWIASKMAVVDSRIKWGRDNYWQTTIKIGNSWDILIQVCIQAYISWIEGRTPANNQVMRGNYHR